MAGIVSGGGFEFSSESVGGVWRWRVNANNTQGLGQLYEVSDIQTPYGPFNQTLIPIPENIVVCMSESIATIRQQFAPLMSLVGSTTSFSQVVTEGDSAINVGSVTLQNVGSFGSFMDVTATSNSSWIELEPISASGLSHNETATFNIIASPVNLLNANSPYVGIITFQDNRVPSTEIQITVTLTVNPRPVIQTTPTSLSFTYYTATASFTGAQTISLENVGPLNSSLSASFAKVQNKLWWNFVPTSLGPLASGVSDIITISVDPNNVPASPGTHSDTLRVSSSNASNSPVDVSITLLVV